MASTDPTPSPLPSASRLSWALLVLRVALGLVFVVHGGQKVFETGLSGTAETFGNIGIPVAGLAGPAVALVELLGGIAVLLGLLTRWAALGIAVVMAGAVLLVHLPQGFFLPRGYEFALVNFLVACALVLAGPGAYSVDAGLSRRR